MTVFNSYARYYDLLYRDKDYRGEAHFVENLLCRHAPGSRSILELGCGTGAHAALLAEEGYQVFGVDMSVDMLERANARREKLAPEHGQRLMFVQGDVRSIRVAGKYDSVISLFHVMSYQTDNEDIRAVFGTAMTHLKPGGIFVFDCWYGPAVLTNRPSVRVKEMEDDFIIVTRIAEPVMYANDNIVDVNYHVFVKNKQAGVVEELRETHRMRYLFKPELIDISREFGLECVECAEWKTGNEPGFDSWGVYFVCRAGE
jgi:SAM-dependent methyltransferase